MLKHLTVQDLALVEHLEVTFSAGLTVITGESGAGKSILLAALSLVLGERAASDLLRPGAARLDVSGYAHIEVYLNEVAQVLTGQTPTPPGTPAPPTGLRITP